MLLHLPHRPHWKSINVRVSLLTSANIRDSIRSSNKNVKKVRKKVCIPIFISNNKKENRPQSCFLKFGLAAVIITVNNPNQRFTILPLGIKTRDIPHKLFLEGGIVRRIGFPCDNRPHLNIQKYPTNGRRSRNHETSRPFPHSGSLPPPDLVRESGYHSPHDKPIPEPYRAKHKYRWKRVLSGKRPLRITDKGLPTDQIA